jgi:hypothetical protein
MNYDNSLLKQLWLALPFALTGKPFHMGIETNPDMKCRTLEPDKRIAWFEKHLKRVPNYMGTAVHCWDYWK